MLPERAFQPGFPQRAADLYEEFGLDPGQGARGDSRSWPPTRARREDMKEATNIFRVLIKTLLNAGIITIAPAPFYGMYVDMDELKAEGDRMSATDIAEEGIAYLKTIKLPRPRLAHEHRRRIGPGARASARVVERGLVRSEVQRRRMIRLVSPTSPPPGSRIFVIEPQRAS